MNRTHNMNQESAASSNATPVARPDGFIELIPGVHMRRLINKNNERYTEIRFENKEIEETLHVAMKELAAHPQEVAAEAQPIVTKVLAQLLDPKHLKEGNARHLMLTLDESIIFFNLLVEIDKADQGYAAQESAQASARAKASQDAQRAIYQNQASQQHTTDQANQNLAPENLADQSSAAQGLADQSLVDQNPRPQDLGAQTAVAQNPQPQIQNPSAPQANLEAAPQALQTDPQAMAAQDQQTVVEAASNDPAFTPDPALTATSAGEPATQPTIQPVSQPTPQSAGLEPSQQVVQSTVQVAPTRPLASEKMPEKAPERIAERIVGATPQTTPETQGVPSSASGPSSEPEEVSSTSAGGNDNADKETDRLSPQERALQSFGSLSADGTQSNGFQGS